MLEAGMGLSDGLVRVTVLEAGMGLSDGLVSNCVRSWDGAQ